MAEEQTPAQASCPPILSREKIDRIIALFQEQHQKRSEEIQELLEELRAGNESDQRRDEELRQAIHELLVKFADDEERKNKATLKAARRAAFFTERNAKFASGSILLAGITVFLIARSDPSDIAFQIRRSLPVVMTIWGGLIGYLIFGTKPPSSTPEGDENTGTELDNSDS